MFFLTGLAVWGCRRGVGFSHGSTFHAVHPVCAGCVFSDRPASNRGIAVCEEKFAQGAVVE